MMIYRNQATGQLVRIHRLTTGLLTPTLFEQENIITGERRVLDSLDSLDLVQDD